VLALTWKSLDPVLIVGVMLLIPPAELLFCAVSVIICAALVLPPVTEPKLSVVDEAGVGASCGLVSER